MFMCKNCSDQMLDSGKKVCESAPIRPRWNPARIFWIRPIPPSSLGSIRRRAVEPSCVFATAHVFGEAMASTKNQTLVYDISRHETHETTWNDFHLWQRLQRNPSMWVACSMSLIESLNKSSKLDQIISSWSNPSNWSVRLCYTHKRQIEIDNSLRSPHSSIHC